MGLDLLTQKIPFRLQWGWLSPEGELYYSGNLRLANAYDDLVVGRSSDSQEEQILLMLSRLLEFSDYDCQLFPEQIGQLLLKDFFLLQNLYYEWHPYGIYDREQIESETALIALHFHWPLGDIYQLSHPDRRRWVQQIQELINP